MFQVYPFWSCMAESMYADVALFDPLETKFLGLFSHQLMDVASTFMDTKNGTSVRNQRHMSYPGSQRLWKY